MTLKNLLDCAWKAFEKNDFAEAESHYCRVLEENEGNPSAHYVLGLIENLRGKRDSAIKHFSIAVEREKNNPQLYYNYAHVLQSREKYSKAKKHFELAIELKPDYYRALNNLGALHNLLGELKEAENVLKRAISIDDTRPHAYSNLGNLYKSEARISEAEEFYEKALQCDPTFPPATSNSVFSLCYDHKLSAEEIFQGHLKYEKRMREFIGDAVSHSKRDLQKRSLKIGYVSADFRTHSVAYFFEPILACHDRTRFEIYCYSNVDNPDEITLRFQRYDVNWRNIFGVGYEDVVKQIMNDEIDILVDLSGHTRNNRLKVFMKKPAPVQINYLGYPFSTGLSTMDYKLTDETTDLPGEDKYYTEKLYRLDGCFLAYFPPKDTPEPSPPPCLQNGFVTFGSFNNYSKLNDNVIKLWAQLLVAVPKSRIILKAKPVKDENVRIRLLDKFNAQGVDSDRVELLYHSASTKEHLECYNKIDVALDPFPYNGTTTICESLWMGVPVVSLIGEHHLSRVTYSILKNAGLGSLAASDKDKYLGLAGFLASNTDQLQSLREKLRMALINSPICKYDEFVRKIESAYLFIWQSLIDDEL